jgi:small subunit ribosomal protein S16
LLRIRLVKTGSRNKKTFRVVVAEQERAVKKQCIEILGYFLPTQNPPVLEVKLDRVKYWISKGAIPSDTTACLFKSKGMEGMEKYIVEPRDKKRVKKSEAGKEGGEQPKAKPAEGGKAEAPKKAEEKKPEPPKEEPKA